MYSSKQKALKINLDPRIYGSFAEIGAGQEVSRFFFKAGKASGTIAQSLSAYDTRFSDFYYGPEKQYVSEARLHSILNQEESLLKKVLKNTSTQTLFTFASTVKTKGYAKWGDSHGWMGIRFQKEPLGDFFEIILHFNLLDNNHLMQQQVIGALGVNLIYASFYYHDSEEVFLKALLEGFTEERIDLDYLSVSPLLMNKTRLNLHLVREGYTKAVLFDEKGQVCFFSSSFYKKNLLVTRGSFKPPTIVTKDLLIQAQKAIVKDHIEICEISLSGPRDFDERDLCRRVELMNLLKKRVLVTNYPRFYELSDYFSRHKIQELNLVLTSFHFNQIFDYEYSTTEGGFLEALGILFRNNVKVYLYPSKWDEQATLKIKPSLMKVYDYLLETKQIIILKPSDEKYLSIYAKKVYELIQTNQEGWKEFVPEELHPYLRKDFFTS